jgi:hypothetical protein
MLPRRDPLAAKVLPIRRSYLLAGKHFVQGKPHQVVIDKPRPDPGSLPALKSLGWNSDPLLYQDIQERGWPPNRPNLLPWRPPP